MCPGEEDIDEDLHMSRVPNMANTVGLQRATPAGTGAASQPARVLCVTPGCSYPSLPGFFLTMRTTTVLLPGTRKGFIGRIILRASRGQGKTGWFYLVF